MADTRTQGPPLMAEFLSLPVQASEDGRIAF